MIDIVLAGLGTSGKYGIASATSFIIANALPEESLLKAASAVTGWVLAIVCIWTLTKAVRFLYAKIEEKDKTIQELYSNAEKKADAQREDMLTELKKINGHE